MPAADEWWVDIADLAGWQVDPDGIDDAVMWLRHRCGYAVELPVPEYVGNIVVRVQGDEHDCRDYMR